MKTLRPLLVVSALALAAWPLQAQDMSSHADSSMHAGHGMHGAMPDTSNTLISVLRAQGVFGTLLKAIDAAGLTETLMGPGPFTLFAPTDAAFNSLDKGAVEKLLMPQNQRQLKALLQYHVVQGERFTARELQGRAGIFNYELHTLGGSLAISSAQQGVFIGGATVSRPDIGASNGVIHVMSGVIIPPSMNDQLKNN